VPSAYDRYLAEKLSAPEYRRIMIGLGRVTRSLTHIWNSWPIASRAQSLDELEQALLRLHDLELLAEKVDDAFVRGHILDRLEELAMLRRSVAEDIRWDVKSKRPDTAA
jgi:prephenate dehydrogenase